MAAEASSKKSNSKAPQQGYYMDNSTGSMQRIPELESDKYKASGKLEGKIAVITGGDSGIGAAAAIAFAKEGADVVIMNYHSVEDANAIVDRIKQLGRDGFSIQGDVGNEKFAQRAVAKIVKKYGRIDILVNNAAEQHPVQMFTEMDMTQMERTFKTNIFGMFYMAKAVLPHMPKGGKIINTTSVTAYQGSAELVDYASTKGAIVGFTRSLAQNKEIVGKKITVNAVAPGPIWTPLIPASLGADHARKFGKDVLMKRPGQPYELAPSYVYLACDDSSYVTGQVLHVNGGMIVNG